MEFSQSPAVRPLETPPSPADLSDALTRLLTPQELPVGEASQHPHWVLDGARELLELVAHGLAIVTTEGRWIQGNRTARDSLASGTALRMVHGMVEPVRSQEGPAFRVALKQAQAGRRSLVALGGSSLHVAVVPLRPEAAGGEAVAVALLFPRARPCDPAMLSLFARAHGITPSEEQVLSALCQGLNAPEVAMQLQVAVSTVRTHIRNLCAKTGAKGVRQLVQQILTLPPASPQPGQDPVH